ALVNLYGCTVGADTKIGAFVEVQKNAVIGARCKISSHSFICEGVVIEDEVFVGHGVMFTNDRHPRATNPDGSLQTEADWKVEPTRVKRSTSIGTGDRRHAQARLATRRTDLELACRSAAHGRTGVARRRAAHTPNGHGETLK